jgi:signal transduction histidine kinase
MWQIVSQGNIWNNEIMNLSKEGIVFWLDTTIVPFFNRNGDVVNYLAMSHDITKRKNEEDEAIEYQQHVERLNKNLEQFAHTVSHDLKSPLNNANGLVDIIEITLGDDMSDELRQYIDLLKITNGKMRSLIDGILKYAKASGKNQDLEQINLRDFVVEVGETLTAKGKAKLNFLNELPTVTYNNTVLKQILSNLMSNAIKFCDKEECEIKFSSLDDDHYYHISVSDNGPGVDKASHKDMFKLFNKVNENKEIDSSGVGLATVKKIINESGGNIWVDSELGFGTTFTFTVRKKPRTQ